MPRGLGNEDITAIADLSLRALSIRSSDRTEVKYGKDMPYVRLSAKLSEKLTDLLQGWSSSPYRNTSFCCLIETTDRGSAGQMTRRNSTAQQAMEAEARARWFDTADEKQGGSAPGGTGHHRVIGHDL